MLRCSIGQVIVKPTDSAGSKGVTRVDEPRNLKKSIQYALSYSHSDEFIIEDFITQHGYSSDTDSFSIDGELKFVSFDCQRFDRDAKNPYTPAAYSWPSSMTTEHQEELKNEIQRLLKLLKMKTAVYNIETREGTDGKAYIMEMSPRGGGNRLAECLRYATGVDMITNMVKYSVGLPIDEIQQKPYNGCWAEIILHSDEPGVFKELWISDEIAEVWWSGIFGLKKAPLLEDLKQPMKQLVHWFSDLTAKRGLKKSSATKINM